jgi:hypothetical protein
VLPAAPHHGGVQCGAKRDDADFDNAIPQRCDARTLINLSVSSRHQKNDSQKDEGSIDRLGNAFGIEFQDPERRAANSAGLTIFVPLNSGKGKCFLLPVTK